jgi:hypothetical protein
MFLSFNPVHILITYSLKVHFSIILFSTSHKQFFTQGYQPDDISAEQLIVISLTKKIPSCYET